MTRDEWRSELVRSSQDQEQILARSVAATTVALIFERLGHTLHVGGHLFGPDRVKEESPFKHGSDDVVAVSRLFLIAAQLLAGTSVLISGGRPYAGAALVRQLVEVEYLVSAFAGQSDDARNWLRSDKKQRMKFFSPSALREKTGQRFKKSDYEMHCELGGHPVPNCYYLLVDTDGGSQIILSDSLMHAESISHFGRVFCDSKGIPLGHIFDNAEATFSSWRDVDAITLLSKSPFNQSERWSK